MNCASNPSVSTLDSRTQQPSSAAYACALNLYAYTCFLKHSSTLLSLSHTHTSVSIHMPEKKHSICLSCSVEPNKRLEQQHSFLWKHKITSCEEILLISHCPNQRVYSMCSDFCFLPCAYVDAWYAHLYVMNVKSVDTCKYGLGQVGTREQSNILTLSCWQHSEVILPNYCSNCSIDQKHSPDPVFYPLSSPYS